MSVAIAISSRKVYVRSLPMRLHLELAAAISLLAVLAFRVWLKVEATDMGYELAHARQHAIELDMKRRELDLALSVLQRSETIQSRAKHELGLQAMDPRQARRM